MSILRGESLLLIYSWGNFFFFKEGVWGHFLKVILMSLIEFQNVFPMINFDVWDRLGHVQTIFDIVGLWGSIFHCNTYEDSMSKWADWSVYKHFIRKLLIKALQTLKSAHFHTKSSQICQWTSIFTTQRYRKWFKHVPIGPKHQD